MALTVEGTLQRLATCLCESLAAAGRSVCRCCLIPGTAGTSLTSEGCECGLAWVRLAQLAPPTGRKAQACLARPGEAVLVTATIEVGVRRCFPAGSGVDSLAQVTCECAQQHALDLLADMNVMYGLPHCCDLDPTTRYGPYVPDGPEGLCVGARLTLFVPAWVCVDCPSPAESPGESPGESP
ncbi:MAG: hypothetical protein ACRDQD_08220 [Nocardioidaceae bacterium]